MAIMKCPHCGREYSQRACKPLVPSHDQFLIPGVKPDNLVIGAKCPGSGQVPRNADTDRRPLWKDDPELKKGAV